MPAQNDRSRWPQLRSIFEETFRQKTRDQWCRLLEGTDVCFAPVLTLEEAVSHEHMRARETYAEIDGVVQPRPAPRFSRTAPDLPEPPRAAADTAPEDALAGWDIAARLAGWQARGAF